MNLSKVISQLNLRELIDYMNLTFFTHFNLYKYVFCNERENNVLDDKRLVNCPSSDSNEETGNSLSEAKTYKLWEYEQSQAKLDKRSQDIKNRFDKERTFLEEKEKKLKNRISSQKDIEEDELNEKVSY